MGLRPRKALLNDVNPHVINFYRQLQRGLRTRISMRNERDLYYQHRDDFNRLISGNGTSTKKAAELFYFLNRTGYNGLCRFNSSGRFNVPFGRFSKINYTRNFQNYAERLKSWTFVSGDFATLKLRDGDFLYADPPYDVQFVRYAQDGFDWNEQVRLAQWLTAYTGPVIASNQATARVLELYGDLGFEVKVLQAPRRISCNGDRAPAQEMLACKGL